MGGGTGGGAVGSATGSSATGGVTGFDDSAGTVGSGEAKAAPESIDALSGMALPPTPGKSTYCAPSASIGGSGWPGDTLVRLSTFARASSTVIPTGGALGVSAASGSAVVCSVVCCRCGLLTDRSMSVSVFVDSTWSFAGASWLSNGPSVEPVAANGSTAFSISLSAPDAVSVPPSVGGSSGASAGVSVGCASEVAGVSGERG